MKVRLKTIVWSQKKMLHLCKHSLFFNAFDVALGFFLCLCACPKCGVAYEGTAKWIKKTIY